MNENNLIKIILKGQYVERLLFVLYFKSLIIVLMMSLCIIVMSSGFLNGESELHTMMHSSKEADTYQTRRIECFKRPNSYWWLKLENNFLFVLTHKGNQVSNSESVIDRGAGRWSSKFFTSYSFKQTQ